MSWLFIIRVALDKGKALQALLKEEDCRNLGCPIENIGPESQE